MYKAVCESHTQSARDTRIARRRRAFSLFVISSLVLLLSPCARAVVTTLLWYRLGENDPGANPGIAATNTIDTTGTNPLPVFGQATYSSDVADSASAHVGSSLSMQFTNSAYALSSGPALSLTNNFGIECWVKPVSSSSSQVIAYNGNTALSGWGLIIDGGVYTALFGGQVEFGSGVIVPNIWTHLAMVRTNGTAVFYVNGIPSGSSTTPPNLPSGAFALAAPPQVQSSQLLTGGLDEVRIFTFAPGEFSQSDLLLNHNDLVLTLADDGSAGSLRGVLADAFDGDKITFLVNGTITLTNGEIPVTADINIAGPGPTNLMIDGNAANRAFTIGSASQQVQMSGLTIRNCLATSTFGGLGGAIYNTGSLTLSNCVVSSSESMAGANASIGGAAGGFGGNGGAIYNSGTLSLTACTLAGNQGGPGGTGAPGTGAFGPGGSGGNGGNGGAIFSSGTLTLSSCTLTGNSAGAAGQGGPMTPISNPGVPGLGGIGGAIYNSGAGTLTSCTVDDNAVASSGMAGGIYNSGVMTLIASTVTRNNGQLSGGGVYSTNEFTARNSLFAENTAASSPDYFGPFFSQGHNLIGNDAGSFGFFPSDNDIVGTSAAPINPVIAPLADNGGLTATVALRAGSPAIDTGDDTLLSAGITTDQRGAPRKSGAHVDIGAYEAIIGTAPRLTSLGISSQTFGLAFTNIPYAAFTVLSTTNVALPLSSWTEAGSPMETSPGQFQFFDPSTSASPQQFYEVRSP